MVFICCMTKWTLQEQMCCSLVGSAWALVERLLADSACVSLLLAAVRPQSHLTLIASSTVSGPGCTAVAVHHGYWVTSAAVPAAWNEGRHLDPFLSDIDASSHSCCDEPRRRQLVMAPAALAGFALCFSSSGFDFAAVLRHAAGA